MRLWLLRHARPLVADGTCYGRLDVAAAARHSQQAAVAFVDAWAGQPGMAGDEAGRHALTVRSSPARRCLALTRWLGDLLTPAIQVDDRLLELDFGTWEGRRWADLPAAAFDGWTADFANGRPGETGESVAELLARVGAALSDWQSGGRDEVWVTHAGVIRAVQWLQQGRGLPASASQWNLPAPAFGQWIQVTAADAR